MGQRRSLGHHCAAGSQLVESIEGRGGESSGSEGAPEKAAAVRAAAAKARQRKQRQQEQQQTGVPVSPTIHTRTSGWSMLLVLNISSYDMRQTKQQGKKQRQKRQQLERQWQETAAEQMLKVLLGLRFLSRLVVPGKILWLALHLHGW